MTETKARTYRGVDIERTHGWYVAFIVDYGFLRADTLGGIRKLIASALNEVSR